MTNKFERQVKGLLGTKLGMTQVWDEDGKVVPVTVVKADSNVITQIRNQETDGYHAVQIGFGSIDSRKVTKPLAGHFERPVLLPCIRHFYRNATCTSDQYKFFPNWARIYAACASRRCYLSACMGICCALRGYYYCIP